MKFLSFEVDMRRHLTEILWCLTWLAIAAFVVLLACGCAAASQAPTQHVTGGNDVDARQTADQTTGGQAQRADSVAGNQTAYQFDLSRHQMLLGMAVLAGLAVAGIGGAVWLLFLGWYSPEPTDRAVTLLARAYLLAYPSAVVIGCGVVVWCVLRLL